MNNILAKYLEERYKHEQKAPIKEEPGPVVTISRKLGCSAKIISDKLAEQLTRQKKGKQPGEWRVINKEILDSAAKELGVEPEKIAYIFKFQKRSLIDEVLEAFSEKYYKSERRIKNTLKEVIYTFGKKGNTVIIGRAGASITHGIPKSFHVKLTAPLEDRKKTVAHRFSISAKEAEDKIKETDENRANLRNDFAGKRIGYDHYDMVLNTSRFTPNQIVELIIHAMQQKGIID
ncbi:MAG: cytidylate kinase-like family protein [Bacteroidales bacterium]